MLEMSEWGRPIIWLAQWSSYGGKASGWCAFSTKDEAIKYAILQAQGNVDWKTFPDPAKLYPYDDRDSTYPRELTPIFRATWDGGYSQVTKTEVENTFSAADYAMTRTAGVFSELMNRRNDGTD